MAKEISKDFDQELDIALDEVLDTEENLGDNDDNNDNDKADMNKNEMDDKDKYKLMLAQQTNHLAVNQRRVLTMQSVNRLSHMINDMEQKTLVNNGL